MCKPVTISVGKTNMSCHYCDKNNHNTADCRAISKFKQWKKNCFVCRKNSSAFLFEEITTLKRQLTHEKTAGSNNKKRKAEPLLFTKINESIQTQVLMKVSSMVTFLPFLNP
jgi:hypothetical protein